MNETINPENVSTVYYAVLGLLHGLNERHSNPISLNEQALALEQLRLDLKSSADRLAAYNPISS